MQQYAVDDPSFHITHASNGKEKRKGKGSAETKQKSVVLVFLSEKRITETKRNCAYVIPLTYFTSHEFFEKSDKR